MTRSNKLSASLLASTLVLTTVLSACGSGTKDGEGTPDPAATNGATPAAKAPVTIKMFNRVNAGIVVENNPVVAEAEKLANVKLSIEAPPINNYTDKLKVMMASGELPDLIYNWGGADASMETWAQNGLLLPLDDKISKYPNLMKNITKEMWDSVKSVNDGKIYMVPRTNIVNHWGYMVNQVWLDKLGLKAPETLDELTNVLRAFTKNDPDGNGKADTYGLSQIGVWAPSNFIAMAFDLPLGNGVKDTDGNYKIKEKMSGYIPYLTYLKQLRDEKIIDPEFIINKSYVDLEKLNQGKVGMVPSHQYGVMVNLGRDKDADKKFTYHGVLKNSKGEARNLVTVATWGGWMISKNSKNPDEVLRFLDWGNTPEANALFQIGLKGLTYDSYDPASKALVRSPEQASKVNTLTSTYMTLANAINGEGAIIENADSPEKLAKFKEQWAAAQKKMTTENVPAVRSPKLLNLGNTIPDLIKEKDEQEQKYITGEITVDQLKSFLEKKWYPATADAEKEYIEFMNKLAK